ncbi:oligosaccharide flippase family protein, partial [Escherichia coli]|uniref:oligosaccharide flippase family protein n=1 Tax=Escherichia coli TaxID=562 RepID=UPI001CBC5857
MPYFIRLLHFRMHNVFPTLRPKYKWKYKRYLLRIGFNFVITNISVALYTRFSLLAIGLFLSKSYVGVYSVAVTLATAWIF